MKVDAGRCGPNDTNTESELRPDEKKKGTDGRIVVPLPYDFHSTLPFLGVLARKAAATRPPFCRSNSTMAFDSKRAEAAYIM